MSLTTRQATKDDAERIAALHAESWRQAYRGIYGDHYLDHEVEADRLAVWRERFAAPDAGQFVLVAEDEAGLAGFCCAYGDEDARWGSLIDNLHVLPSYRRSGAGTTLMRETGLWLREHYPDAGVYLWVLEANAGARRFYERLGARDEGVVETDVPGGRAAVCRYVWASPDALLAACR